jgi:ubiquitin-conjugating enzyme E2 J1
MAPSPTIRRLLKETAELSTDARNPSAAFHAQPVSDSDLHEWHFTLLGPPSPSPYAGGLYHGRITLPAQYPLKPPNFRFLTPSGRFEVNREICLSISGFHEETWMPAWGVRTALTALRTFMAEKGSAGQVGGFEASAEVRTRLAKESRGWRCEGCGRKSNEDIMREWWQSCRERGVEVDEEGADVSMDALPEGMNVEARDKSVQKEARQQQDHAQLKAAPTISPTAPQVQPPPPATTAADPPSSSPRSQQNLPTIPTSASIPLAATPTPEQIQSRAEAVLTPSEQAPSNSTRPMMNLHAGPLAAATRTIEQEAQRERREQQPTITIDRAIAGIFLALVLMLLKKIFYPAQSSGIDYVDGGGGYYLEREF